MGEDLSLLVPSGYTEPMHQQDPAWSTGSPIRWMLQTGMFAQWPCIYDLV